MPYSNTTNTTAMGKISYELNIRWFMKIAEEEGWVMIDDCFSGEWEDYELTFGCDGIHGDDHDFWLLCENKITKILEHGTIELHGEYSHECLENAVFQELMDDEQFKDEFNKHFISREHFYWIEETTDQMSSLNTGDQFQKVGNGEVLIEKLHDGRWGVRTLEDKAVIREHAGDWFVSQRVVLIADYPHVQMERETAEEENLDWVDTVADALAAAHGRGENSFTVNLPPEIAAKLMSYKKKETVEERQDRFDRQLAGAKCPY